MKTNPLQLIPVFLAAASVAARADTPAPGPADFATRVLAHSGVNGYPGYNSDGVPPSDGDAVNALGPPSADATPDTPDNTSVFSFGWGGSITLGFDRPITDDPRHPGGYDFVVFGNAFYQGGDTSSPWREPGYVEVGVDPAGQHQYGPGVVWYWLKGSPAPSSLAGFPIPPPAAGTPTLGYADCIPTDGEGDPLIPSDPAAPGITPGSAGGDAFDLAWAVDAGGQPAHLASADFVRVTCAVSGSQNPFGQYSTEVDAVALVRPRVAGDVDFDNSVTLADAERAARFVAGQETFSDEQKLRADTTNHGGDPTLADAALLLRISAGLAP